MKANRSLLFLLLVSSCVLSVYGQQKLYTGTAFSGFDVYRGSLEADDVEISIPDNYTMVDMQADSRFDFFTCYRPEYYNPYKPGLGLQSPDGNAVLVYPVLFLDMAEWTLVGWTNLIDSDIRSAFDDRDIDVMSKVEAIVKEDMSAYSNADTVAIYDFTFDNIGINFMDRYNHCVSVALRKVGHPGLLLRVMLNDEGYKNKEQYLRNLFDSLRYGDKQTPLTAYETKIKRGIFEFQSEPLRHSVLSENVAKRAKVIEFIREKWKAENDSLNSLSQ